MPRLSPYYPPTNEQDPAERDLSSPRRAQRMERRGCVKSGHNAAPLPPFSSPPPFQDVFQRRVSQQISVLGRSAGTCWRREHLSPSAGLLCRCRRAPETGEKPAGRIFVYFFFFFCQHACNFPFAKISKGGEGGREARKEIKTHFCLAVKEARGKSPSLRRPKSPLLPSPLKDVLTSSRHGA